MKEDFVKVFNLKDLKEGEQLDNVLWLVRNGKIHDDVLKFDSVETMKIAQDSIVPTVEKWLKVGIKAGISKGIVIGASAVLFGLGVFIVFKQIKKLRTHKKESKSGI